MDTPKKLQLSWQDVEKLINCLVPRLQGYDYDLVIAITRGGIIPGGIIAEQLGVQQVLIASVDFYEDEAHKLDWPVFMQFPADSFLRGQSVLVVDDVWNRGKEVVSVMERVEQAGGNPRSVVLHYKPDRSIFEDKGPDFFGAETDAWVVYPWEIDRNTLGVT
ncbi:MAG: phosphoribosyltransferase family protein [Chloroflexota bacterium]